MLMNNSSDYYILYPCAGRTRRYTFSIDSLTPVRAMTKRELAALYFPDEPLPELARKAFFYDTQHARQPAARLSDNDAALARQDGNVYLADVLRDICPIDTTPLLRPAHVAAIMHFLGPPPDMCDILAEAA